MNKKGFTLIEVVISLSMGLFIFYSIIYVPTQLLKNYKTCDKILEQNMAINNLTNSITKDISISNGNISTKNTSLIIGESAYRFEKNGVYRTNKSKKTKLSNIEFDFDIEDDFLIISSRGEDNKNNFLLKYNIPFSSLLNEED